MAKWILSERSVTAGASEEPSSATCSFAASSTSGAVGGYATGSVGRTLSPCRPRFLSDLPSTVTTSPASLDPTAELPFIVVEPKPAWGFADVRDLWHGREVLFYLTLRDIKLRYKQTVLGVGWAVFQPASTVIVFAIVFGWLSGVSRGIENYPLFVLAGVLPWTLFANAITTAANSLVANERLVTKTYFPRLILPVSCVAAALFDFLVGCSLLTIWAVIVGIAPTDWLLFTPIVVALIALGASGFGTLLSALIVTQRDFRHLITFAMPLWMFATPCIYLAPEAIAPLAREWLPLNPAYGLILNFRACVLGTEPDLRALAISAAVSVVMLAVALVYFHRVERTMADTI